MVRIALINRGHITTPAKHGSAGFPTIILDETIGTVPRECSHTDTNFQGSQNPTRMLLFQEMLFGVLVMVDQQLNSGSILPDPVFLTLLTMQETYKRRPFGKFTGSQEHTLNSQRDPSCTTSNSRPCPNTRQLYPLATQLEQNGSPIPTPS